VLGLARLGGYSQSGGNMLPSQGSAQDVESARAVVLIVAAVAAIFWKELLRVLIALIVIAVGIGLFMLMQGVHG
jgi:hypothetical protein